MTKMTNEEQEWLQVYEYWKDVPTILEIDDETFKEVVAQDFRAAILTILREGIIDDYTREHNLPRRHALSAPEMFPLLRDKLGSDVLLSNVYWHLEKLEKYNLIRKIITRLEGRHHVTYYGRTAKLILGGKGTDLKSHIIAFSSQILELSAALKSDTDTPKLYALFKKILHRGAELNQMEREWIEKNHDIIIKRDIPVLELSEFLVKHLRGRDEVLQNLYSQLYEELGFEIYKN